MSHPNKSLRLAALVAASICIACDNSTAPAGPPSALHPVTAASFNAVAGTTIPGGVTVRAVDARGNSVSGARVAFTVTAGDGTVAPHIVLSGADGTAHAEWTIGQTAGQNSLLASIEGVDSTTTFSATGTTGPATAVVAAPHILRFPVGTTTGIFAGAVVDQFGNAISSATTYVSRNTSLVTVSATGVVTVVAGSGTTYVVATGSNFSDSTLVIVLKSGDPACTGITAHSALAVGEVTTTGFFDNGICVDQTTTGGEYAIVPYFNSSVSNAQTAFTLSVFGNRAAQAVFTSTSRAGTPLIADAGVTATASAQAAFHDRIRLAEEQAMPAAAPGARLWYNSAERTAHRALRAAVVPAVGDLMQLNVNPNDFCSNPSVHTGRVAAVTQRAVVVSDNANPLGFTDAELQSFGMTFDTLVYALDISNFGSPTDIDENGGRVVLFFTHAVNDVGAGVLGYYYGRDLLPKVGPLGSCPGSNVSEIMYLLVPDASTSKTFVLKNTVGTVAHEFQHMINAGRRLYVNTSAAPTEERWLNEGLSHVAEELMFYRVSGLKPRQNLGAEIFTPPDTLPFRQYQFNNFSRLNAYLQTTGVAIADRCRRQRRRLRDARGDLVVSALRGRSALCGRRGGLLVQAREFQRDRTEQPRRSGGVGRPAHDARLDVVDLPRRSRAGNDRQVPAAELEPPRGDELDRRLLAVGTCASDDGGGNVGHTAGRRNDLRSLRSERESGSVREGGGGGRNGVAEERLIGAGANEVAMGSSRRLPAVIAAICVACTEPGVGPPHEIRRLTAATFNAVAGSSIPSGVGVKVVDARGKAVSGIRVAFTVTRGDGTVGPHLVVSDAEGNAHAEWTVGTTVGENSLIAWIDGAADTATFTATVTAGAATAVAVVPHTLRIPVDTTTGGVAGTVVDKYGNFVSTGVTFTSRNPSLVTVNATTGNVTVVGGGGTTYIVATSAGFSDSSLVIVLKSTDTPCTGITAHASPAVGAVITTGFSDNGICVDATTTGAEYAWVPYFNSSVASAQTAITLSVFGNKTPGPLNSAGRVSTPLLKDVIAATDLASAAAFHDRLRSSEQRALRAGALNARLWYSAGQTAPRALRSAVIPKVGDRMRLNVNPDESLQQPGRPHRASGGGDATRGGGCRTRPTRRGSPTPSTSRSGQPSIRWSIRSTSRPSARLWTSTTTAGG